MRRNHVEARAREKDQTANSNCVAIVYAGQFMKVGAWLPVKESSIQHRPDPACPRHPATSKEHFYEWAKTANSKQPYCFEVNNGELFAFAGLLGWVEGLDRKLDKNLLHSDHNSQSGDLNCPRPDASDPSSREL
jgi:hypothetical protein